MNLLRRWLGRRVGGEEDRLNCFRTDLGERNCRRSHAAKFLLWGTSVKSQLEDYIDSLPMEMALCVYKDNLGRLIISTFDKDYNNNKEIYFGGLAPTENLQKALWTFRRNAVAVSGFNRSEIKRLNNKQDYQRNS